MTCTYAFNRDGERIVINGQAAFKAYLAAGGLELLMGRAAPTAQLSRTRGEQAENDYAKLREKYIGTPEWLKAPNGEPTKLTERQWLQVRTPQFKEWFGDWEKHARAENPVGSLWSDDAVSKVVDENGEPLVVYHGTDKGGFSAFRQPGGEKRGDLGIWATSSRPMAMTYQKRGRSAEIRFTDMDRAPIEGGDTSGYYVSFMNIRNPYESDFEGAYWNGERRDQWVVTKAGEMEYTSAGKGYFDSESEAQEFADKIGGYVDEAPEHYESTDRAVRQARTDGNDGTIIRNVIDDGGGYSSYAGEPSDVFVAFSPDQIKSATQNTGEFGTDTEDMRFSRPRFYSQLERSISEVPARLDNQPAPQWKAWLASNAAKLGIKKDEIEWSGINDYFDLRGKDKVSKAEIGAYLSDSGVKVNTVTYGELSDKERFAEAQRIALDEYGVEYGELDGDDQTDIDESIDENNSQYGEYTLPGGENYREVVITLPSMGQKATERMMYLEAKRRRMSTPSQWVFDDDAEGKELKALQAKAKEDTFQSSHFEAKNIVAHMRVNDRTDADGNKVLFVEEVQSDWGQQGKKRGFKGDAAAAQAALKKFTADMVAKYGIEGMANGKDTPEEQAEFARLSNAASVAKNGIPTAPFVTKTEGWLNLALKRIAMMAVEGGYDKVAFVNGMQSADRYDLSKQINSIGYDPKTRRLEAYDKNRKSVMNRTGVAEDQLEDYVGKEVAKRLLEQPLVMGKHLLEGENIKVGGEGMITFYDKIVPQAMSKLLPKLGGDKLTTVNMTYDPNPELDTWEPEDGEGDGSKAPVEQYSQTGFDVTDKMRETVGAGVPLFSPRRNIFGQQAPLANWTRPTDSQMDDVIYKLQDKQVDTKRVVQAIKEASGTIDDRWDAYLQEELYHGRAARSTKNFLNDELAPLLKDMQDRKVSLEDFEEYLHNRHAEERNIQMAKVNPNMPDGGSGIDTADARAYLRKLPQAQRHDFEVLAKKVDAITANTRKLLVDSGLETQDTMDAWEGAYKNYVPLFREDADYEPGGRSMGTGKGFSVRGSASKRAQGSSREVVDILANLAMQREATIVRAEKVRVAAAVYGMAVQNPNTDFWLAVDPEGQKDPNKAIADLMAMGINPIDARNIIEEPVQSTVDPRTGLVVQRVNPLLRSSDNVLAVRIDGRERYVFFNQKDPRAERMVTALKNLDAAQLEGVTGFVAPITRYIASVNTQYNPIFGIVNLVRDTGGAVANLSSTELAGSQTEVLSNVPAAIKGIYADLRAERAGRGKPTGVWASLWEEFQQTGGQTGYRDQYSSSTTRAEALQKMLNPDTWMDSKLGKVFTADGRLKVPYEVARKTAAPIFDWLSDYNETLENAVRLSAYKAGLDKGLSKERAASIAKNLTVNFNRKGQIATEAGAWYAFFNASVQGTARLYETLSGPAGKKIIYGGLAVGVAQALLLAAAGFGEDEPPEFVRERNLVIPISGGKYISIPLPLGLHIIPNTSRVLTEFALSGWKNPTKRVGQIFGAVLDAFNPIGNAGWSAQTLTPTVVDPIVALTENRDFTGKPIAKKDRSDLNPTPGYTRAKDTASWVGKQVAYALNMMTGGTKYKQGLLSPTPDQIDYLIGQATGGVGRELLKGQQVVESAITGEELPMYKVPLAGRFIGETKGQAPTASQFYTNVTKINEHENELKGRRKNREETASYLRDNPEARLVQYANSVESEVSKLRTRKRDLLERGASKESIKMIEAQITRKMEQLNSRVKQAEEQAQ